MRNISLTTSLFALSLSLITSAAWASPGQGSGDNGLTEADVDRTISLEAGDMWFDPEELELAAGEVILPSNSGHWFKRSFGLQRPLG